MAYALLVFQTTWMVIAAAFIALLVLWAVAALAATIYVNLW